MHASLFSTHRASIPVCVASRPPAPRRGTAVRVVARGAECELHVDTPRRDGSTPTRRDLLAGTVGLFAGSSLFPNPPALAADSLSQRLERRDLNKPVFNKARPGPQQYPDWMEGTWSATADFQGYSFPSKTMNPKLLVKEPTVPGFQKLSVVYIPDIGSTQVRYEMRFGRKEPGGPVLEDRAFNLRSVVDGYLNQGVGPTMIKRAVEDVEYDPMTDPNRTTVRLVPGASVNAERIELFANARESELRPSDGTFFCSEATRQVTLGYGREYGQARVINTDYMHVWSFTPEYDKEEFGVREEGGERATRPDRVRVSLSTAGYVQPSDALRLTAAPGVGGGAPVPQMGFAGTAAFEPAVLYSHAIILERQ